MKKILFIIVFVLSLINCDAHKSTLSTKNEVKAPIKIINGQTGYEIREIEINNIKYCYELNKLLDTVAIRTYDARFISKENFKVGTKWIEIPYGLRMSTYELSGFGYYIELESGWNLVFCIGKTCTDNEPDNYAKVIYIEKRMHQKLKDNQLIFKTNK